MIFEIIKDIVKLVFIITSLYIALGYFVRKKQSVFSETLEKCRFTVLLGLILLVLAAKISEDVLWGESGPIDKAVLLFIHSLVPASITPFFATITFTGSSKFLFPVTSATTILFLLAKRRSEALLLATSVISAAVVVFVIKILVARARPALWDTEWYWGASFPSGHTLVVTAFATAAYLCILKIRPNAQPITFIIVTLWIFLVGLSRLVLGVHWPTDVLVAVCIGAFLPLAISVVMNLHQR